jgi:hypothetical protein
MWCVVCAFFALHASLKSALQTYIWTGDRDCLCPYTTTMAHEIEMIPIDSKSSVATVRKVPSRSKSSLTDDKMVMSRMGATQELKV